MNEYLKELREKANLSIDDLAKILKITPAQVEILEKGEFNKIPAFVLRQIFEKYKNFFKLKEDLYIKGDINFGKNNNFKKENTRFIFDIPFIFIFFLLISTLIFYQIFTLIMPPKIKIIYPPDNLITNYPFIKIKGYTDTRSILSINNEIIVYDEKGYFEKDALLKIGENKFVLESKNYFGLKNTKILKIYYYPSK